MKFLSQFAAWRWLAYLVVLPLMVFDEACRGARCGWDLWRALTEQHEAGHLRRQSKVITPVDEVTMRVLRSAVATLDKGSFMKAKPIVPPNEAKTIKFRRYSPFPESA